MLKYKLLFIIILTTSIVSGQTWNSVSKKIDQKDSIRVSKGILFGTNLLNYSSTIPYWNGANFGSAVTVPFANVTVLSDSLLARYTKVQSNAKYAAANHNHSQSQVVNLSDSLLNKPTKAQAILKYEIMPLAVFGAGSGALSDTSVFTTTALYGSFYNKGSDTLVITSLYGIIQTGSGSSSVTIQVSWHSTIKSASAIKLKTVPPTITNITTGNETTSFDNPKIPPNVWVWCTTPTSNAGAKPSYLSITLSGYRK